MGCTGSRDKEGEEGTKDMKDAPPEQAAARTLADPKIERAPIAVLGIRRDRGGDEGAARVPDPRMARAYAEPRPAAAPRSAAGRQRG